MSDGNGVFFLKCHSTVIVFIVVVLECALGLILLYVGYGVSKGMSAYTYQLLYYVLCI